MLPTKFGDHPSMSVEAEEGVPRFFFILRSQINMSMFDERLHKNVKEKVL
jgi:hypothetical protein